jgi:molecular chaperone DnaK (HSP70)
MPKAITFKDLAQNIGTIKAPSDMDKANNFLNNLNKSLELMKGLTTNIPIVEQKVKEIMNRQQSQPIQPSQPIQQNVNPQTADANREIKAQEHYNKLMNTLTRWKVDYGNLTLNELHVFLEKNRDIVINSIKLEWL